MTSGNSSTYAYVPDSRITLNYGYFTSYYLLGILTDDLVDNTLYVSVLSEGYAARVSNFRNYLSVSTDVLRRWLHPIVPEVDVEDKDYRCKLHRRNVYKCPDAILMQ